MENFYWTYFCDRIVHRTRCPYSHTWTLHTGAACTSHCENRRKGSKYQNQWSCLEHWTNISQVNILVLLYTPISSHSFLDWKGKSHLQPIPHTHTHSNVPKSKNQTFKIVFEWSCSHTCNSRHNTASFTFIYILAAVTHHVTFSSHFEILVFYVKIGKRLLLVTVSFFNCTACRMGQLIRASG